MGVSENGGTPKASILIGFSIINHPFWGTPIFGNTQMVMGFMFFFSPHKWNIVLGWNHPLIRSPLIRALPSTWTSKYITLKYSHRSVMDIYHFMTPTWSVEVEKIGELMPTAHLSMQHYIGKPDRWQPDFCLPMFFFDEMLSKLEPARWEGSPKWYGTTTKWVEQFNLWVYPPKKQLENALKTSKYTSKKTSHTTLLNRKTIKEGLLRFRKLLKELQPQFHLQKCMKCVEKDTWLILIKSIQTSEVFWKIAINSYTSIKNGQFRQNNIFVKGNALNRRIEKACWKQLTLDQISLWIERDTLLFGDWFITYRKWIETTVMLLERYIVT